MAGALVALAFAVLAFSGGWQDGEAVLDGPGTNLYLRLALDNLSSYGRVPYWMPEMWAGTPVWALAPSFPVFVLMPIAQVAGTEAAIKVALLAFQVLGGLGAFVLARALWQQTAPAAVAGLLYGLHPYFMSHGPFAGAETSVGVMAVTPWMVWSLRRALRGEGAHHVVLSGLMAAFAVLQQAEHAYGLALLCAFLLAVELARVRLTGTGPTGPAGVLFRATVVVLIALGSIAFWLAPFVTNSTSFALTPPDLVRHELEEGTGARVGEDLGIFLDRSDGIFGTVAFERTDLAETGAFYLGAVCVVLTLVTICLLPRHDPDGTLTAILVASALGVWMSTGAVSLAAGDLATKGHILTFILIGVISGVLIGSLLRGFGATRLALVGGVAGVLVLMAVPYLTPFLALQRVVPFLESIRFPRFYTLAPMGLALGASYPLVLVHRWAADRQRQLAPVLTAAAAVAVMGMFLVDIHPYRSFYRLHLPEGAEAYAEAERRLAETGGTARIATGSFGDPRLIDLLLRTGHTTSVGWPHPLAAKRTWRVTVEALLTPPGFRDAALALSGTGFMARERVVASGDVRYVDQVELEPNPRVLPLVRAYDRALVVRDDAIAPQLAASLAQRNIGLVTGGEGAREQLGEGTLSFVDEGDACPGEPGGEAASEIATACALQRWAGVLSGAELLDLEEPVGAVFESPLPDLRGVSVWLTGRLEPTELAIWELAPDGRSLGREVARVQASGFDEYGMAAFRFDPIPASAGARYVFMVRCDECEGGEEHHVMTLPADRGPANLVVNGVFQRRRVAAFTPIYDRPLMAPPSATTVRATRDEPGRWRLQTSGPGSSLVVVAESWFPGWRASVDGKRAPVLLADGAFLGVPVGPGDHEVVLEYQRPKVVWLGRLLTAATLAFCSLLLVASYRQRRGRARRGRARRGRALRPPPERPERGGSGGGRRQLSRLRPARSASSEEPTGSAAQTT